MIRSLVPDFMTLYATGARCSELTHLKISAIDSQRMVVHIRDGKGRKDRDVMLSPKLLTALRTHCCPGGPCPQTFPPLRSDFPKEIKTRRRYV
jgi:integrase